MSDKTEVKYKASNGIELTYMEDPYPVQNYMGKQKLLVIFQSLGDEKSDDQRKRYPYTLIDGLRFYNCRKLYIKDDRGIAGDYYLGLNGKLDTKDAVSEFLKKKIVEYGISRENITTFGFSKGGYAALMFGFELGAANIITAVPQFNLWSWISKYKPFLDYILPENPSQKDKEYYAHYLKNVIECSISKPNVYVVTSHNDNTYNDHIPQLIETLEIKGIEPKIYHNDEYTVTRHNNVVVNSMNEIFAILSIVLSDKDIRNLFN
ncbi:hypothetical protein [Bacillus sp. H1a]|uniref:hypothetical protein n=1 Tax=Bacillus sp. H1a TaxID=1397276 RepID=UPI0004686572|nr:hypothetical protein [Bacillus sp. H1a]